MQNWHHKQTSFQFLIWRGHRLFLGVLIFRLILFSLLGLSPIAANPVITEFVASNINGLLDEDGDTSDWVEIHNPTSSPIDLVGWNLTDSPSDLSKWTFPAITLQADAYLVVFASGKNRKAIGAELHTNFRLSAGGESLSIVSPEGTPSMSFEFPAQVAGFSYGTTPASNTLALISDVASTRVLIPDSSDNAAIGNSWQESIFDDSSWLEGNLGVGFERGNGFEDDISLDLEAEAWGINSTVYLRIPFPDGIDPTVLTSITLRMKYDDGFAAFLNGTPIASANAPATLNWNSNSTTSRSDSQALQFQDFDLTAHLELLNPDNNLLAIHGLNQFSNSGDLLIRPQLIATTSENLLSTIGYFSSPTPGSINAANNTPDPMGAPSGKVTLSEPSGVKTGDITVELTTENPSVIRYTLDGSTPNTSSFLYSAPLTLSDPSQLRARAYEANRSPGPVATGDYAFLDPSLSGYLSDIPVLIMDNFGAGAYPNKGRSNDGRNIRQRPRQANVMSIFETAPNGQPFSQPATLESRSGCRVRGSSSSQFPRKPLSVEFWDDDDTERKLSPFGMKEEADWILNAPNPVYDRALIHNPVSFGFAKLIGALAPESKVIAVFQNTDGGKVRPSDLEGLYIFSEKIGRNRAGANFKKLNEFANDGGWMLNIDRMSAIPDDLPADTIQPNFHAAGPNGILQIPDDQQNSGGSQSVDDISEYYHSYLNFHSPDGYSILDDQRSIIQSKLRAMDAAVWSPNSSDPLIGYRAHLDPESWARAFTVHNFAKNQDAHVLSTYIYQEDPQSLIQMGPVWDFDRAYTWKGSARSTPLWAADRDWYDGLFDDSDFRQIHQDLWQKARLETITDTALQNLVDTAATGPNAAQVSASGLRFSTWRSRISSLRTWVVDRANYLDTRYEPLPSLSPELEVFQNSIQVNMTPTAGGIVYFTTNGNDPRDHGGAASPSASIYSAPITVNSRTRMMARTKDGSRWSGPVELNYFRTDDLPQLVVSEIHYHPLDPTPAEYALGFEEAKDFEFLELMNIGSSAINLSTLALDGGITFTFPNIILPAGNRIIVADNLDAFTARYGLDHPVTGEFSGSLGNSGDQIIIRDTLLNLELLNFSYSDASPWPTCADGGNYSLVLKNPETSPDHNEAANWRCSSLPGGNPGDLDNRAPFTDIANLDNDGDGLSALLEHFLGTSDSNSSEGASSYQLNTINLPDGSIYPTFSITYPIGADDITPDAFWSSDLQSWSNSPSERILVSETQNGDGSITATWRSNSEGNISPQFFRLQVTKN